MLKRANNRVLQIIIMILALADGVLHLLLDFVLYHGNFFGTSSPSGPPPGTTVPRPAPRANPFILPLNELFLLNFVGAVILVVLFWFSRRRLGERRWLMDIVLIAYEAAAFFAWLIYGRPNPMGLGYLSKGIEIVLIVALAVDTWGILRRRGRVASTSADPQ